MLNTFIKKTSQLAITSLLISGLSSVSIIALLSSNVMAAELTINVKDININEGHLMVALFSGSESYKQNKAGWSSMLKVNGEYEVLSFKDLPNGEYALKLFHDENDNKRLDLNMLGIPKENYGFSNNVGRFGQPSYEEARFLVKENTNIEINLF